MATAEEFWNSIRPSGLTGEQELIAFWQSMIDCKCKSKPPAILPIPRRRRRARRDRDDDVLLFIL